MAGFRQKIAELVSFRQFLLNLISVELKLRYRKHILGFLWTVLNPLFYLLILAVVFSKIMKFQVPHYTIFLLSGLTSWLMVQQTVIIATGSIVNNQGLIKKVYVPRLAFPLSNVLARFVDHIVLTVILIVFMAAFRRPFTWALLFVPVSVLLHFFFTLGLSLLSSVAYIKIRDVQHILAIIFQAMFYVTPIIYPLEILPPHYRPIFLLNPFYYFVETLRAPVYQSVFPAPDVILTAAGLTVLALASGLFLFLRKEREFVFYLS
jgi:ABC-type polysaccharide/polyol phosphate export permease